MKQLLKQVRKRNIRSSRNIYSICDSDHSSNVYPDNSSLFCPSFNDLLNSSSDSHSNYKYKPISKEECLQNESSASSNSGYTIPSFRTLWVPTFWYFFHCFYHWNIDKTSFISYWPSPLAWTMNRMLLMRVSVFWCA